MPSRILDYHHDDEDSLSSSSSSTTTAASSSPAVKDNIPLSEWEPLQHPCVDEVSHEVDQYFLRHWNFPGEKARKNFLAADFSGVTCLYFPLARNDRIHAACRLLTILFLIDGKTLLLHL